MIGRGGTSSNPYFQITTGPFAPNNPGQITFNQYGSGNFPGTSVYNLSVDASGNIIETANSTTGTGTTDHITVWETNDTIYSVTNNTAIANKDFNVIAKQSTANIKLGATDLTYSSVNEGIEIYPNTTHYTTRVTPWLEVYSYEDPALQPDNTYDANYDGSAFLMGKSNTCLLYTSPSPRDTERSRMPSSA